ncbi:hypothetical protein EB796_018537 [Bugula neritina]|uniref:FAD linked oxidase N-terminal domain-containing protein n=1 Tax=Bugula neritina TaxID=10212 RepID=A0A7J7JB19_BUGNE|nr:hypothetical protein EB796_018537 [Bugula neritina]
MDQELSTIVTWILLLSNALVMGQEFTPRSYCTPEDSCWPTTDDFDELQSLNPSMEVITRGDGGWAEASNLVLNRRISETPGAVVYVRNSSHVQAVVKFSQDYNLNLKIISSGHEFIGRNIAPGCLLLSVAYMDEISTDLSCPEHSSGCMNVEPGGLVAAGVQSC